MKKKIVIKENNKKEITRSLYRSSEHKIIGGVSYGMGEYFKLDPTLIRILFILLTFFGGVGIILYLVLWVVLPDKDNSEQERLVEPNNRSWWGVLVIVLGFLFLFNSLGILESFNLDRFWPVILIIFGFLILLKRKS